MNKHIKLIHSKELASVDYAYASQVPRDSEILFLAGACPLDPNGKVPAISNVEEQAKLCVENMKMALKECGATITDVAYTRVLVASTNRAHLVAAWDAVREEFGDHDVPSTLSGVTVLGYPNQLVEVEAVAAVREK
ncbi:RidA family protein [Salirhabdus sp. Marseille-P4669]|uniref:RidA family protein n=1 Tax=Salirhabdus sp. Marseille-P4669 TaxID=2042310 RepID=UPI000C7C5926|nr:RidA family protein [Salirhabdus sp. Marseille-P4669]